MTEKLPTILRNSAKCFDLINKIMPVTNHSSHSFGKPVLVLWVSLLSVLFPLFSFSQIKISPSSLDFGTTNPETQWIIDFIVENKSQKKDYLLRSNFTYEYEILFSSKTMLPDSTIHIRVKFKPRAKGIFKEDLVFYFASMNEPIVIPVKANVQYLNPEDNIPCPDFSRMAADCCPKNMFLVQVIDELTQKPIGNAQVKFIEQGVQQLKLQTNEKGQASYDMPIGYYSIKASSEGYESRTIESYINHNKAYLKIALNPTEKPVEKEKEVEIPEPVIITETLSDSTAVLPINQYNANNIVFLLDISSSMSHSNKLELMKGALAELTKALRPIDKITLISYADNTTLLLSTTSGDQKDTIISIVNALKAYGSTSGAKGFNSAYSMIKQEFMANGNNQLIVVTDGVFKSEDQKTISKLVKKAARKKITTSIVGIKSSVSTIENLSLVSKSGNGSFLPIENEADLKIIIEELKKRSSK
jgi:Mg-chelatase subunit ChlD